MSLITPVYQIETEYDPSVNIFKQAGKYGVALSILGATLGATTPYFELNNDSSTYSPQLNVSYGLSSVSAESVIEEKELNQFSFKGLSSSDIEYVKSSYFTLNGSILEANQEMENEKNDYEILYNEDMVSDFSFEPTAKKILKLPGELVIIKKAKPDHRYFANDFLLDDDSNLEPAASPKRIFKL